MRKYSEISKYLDKFYSKFYGTNIEKCFTHSKTVNWLNQNVRTTSQLNYMQSS